MSQISSELLRIHPPVLIKADEPMCRMPDPDSMGYVFLLPEGPRQINEAGDVYYMKDARVTYHSHQRGCETFLIDYGAVEVTLSHKISVIEKGDLMHIRPGVYHGFHHLVENTIWREVFQEFDMYNSCNQRDILRELRPDILEDPGFQRRRQQSLGSCRREMPKARPVEKDEIPHHLRPAGSSLRSFCMGGMEFGLKVGRWENDGEREIWEIKIPKGTTLEFAEPFASSPLYAILDGTVELSLFDGMETHVGHQRDFLHVPVYTPHSITALEDIRLLAYNVQCELLNALEALNAGFVQDPALRKDWKWVQQTLEEYGCWISGVKRNGQEVEA